MAVGINSIEQKRLTRQELYDLVWSMPMRDLAKQFDISDRGLAKKCESHKIPRPPQGYWLKAEKDRKHLVKPLPLNEDAYWDSIDFYPQPKRLEAKSGLSDEQLAAALEFKMPDSVARYHPLIRKCRQAAKKPKLDNYSRLLFGLDVINPGFKVTPKTFNRACLFLQGMINLFASYGWELKNDGKKAYFSCENNNLEFEIKERVSKQAELSPNPKQRWDSLGWQLQYFSSTGSLELSVTNIYSSGFKKRWYDRAQNTLEKQLGSIVQGFSRAFDARRLWTIECEEQHRKRELEKAERREQARLEKIEEDRRKHLFKLAEQYHRSKSIRDFLTVLEGAPSKPSGMSDWLTWANAVVDENDPLCDQEGIIEKHRRYAEPPEVWRPW